MSKKEQKASDREMNALWLVREAVIADADTWDDADTVEFDQVRPDASFTFRLRGVEYRVSVTRT